MRSGVPPGAGFLAGVLAVVVFAAACGGMRMRPPRPGGPNAAMRPISEREQNTRLLLTFDANGDGMVARDEMETALRRQFQALDANGDGRVDLREMQAENAHRFQTSGTGASPLIDWNQNGQMEYDEFATTARSMLAEFDTDQDGVLDRTELRLPMTGRGRPMPMEGGRRGRGP